MDNVIIKPNKNRKRYAIEIDQNADLIVKTPIKPSQKIIDSLIHDNLDWIKKYQAKVNQTQQALHDWRDESCLYYRGKKYELGCSDTNYIQFKTNQILLPNKIDRHAFLKKHAHLYLVERCLDIVEQMNLRLNKVKIRKMTSCWGTCNINKNITLNQALIQVPDWVSDYVMIHECAHLVHFNHSSSFWALVSEFTPHTKAAKNWLKDHQLVLIN